MAPAGRETAEVRGKGEAGKIKGRGGWGGARVGCPAPHCQACDLNLVCPFWGADSRQRGHLSKCGGIEIRVLSLHTTLFTLEIRIHVVCIEFLSERDKNHNTITFCSD